MFTGMSVSRRLPLISLRAKYVRAYVLCVRRSPSCSGSSTNLELRSSVRSLRTTELRSTLYWQPNPSHRNLGDLLQRRRGGSVEWEWRWMIYSAVEKLSKARFRFTASI